MSTQENKDIVRRFFEEGFSQGEYAVFDEIVAPGARTHDPLAEAAAGPEGMKARASLYRTAFPDLRISLRDFVAEWDQVAVRWSAEGTHRGELSGMAPSGRPVSFTGITVFRFLGGKVQEVWTELDLLGILQQTGGIRTLERAAAVR